MSDINSLPFPGVCLEWGGQILITTHRYTESHLNLDLNTIAGSMDYTNAHTGTFTRTHTIKVIFSALSKHPSQHPSPGALRRCHRVNIYWSSGPEYISLLPNSLFPAGVSTCSDRTPCLCVLCVCVFTCPCVCPCVHVCVCVDISPL